ncbi:Hypothetical predicted protein [Olea europaea subsp. europaea]|uniref:Uncharacterized protein n=1 Tax=Olea europaea subsp. europaea TaxID=158383 RepID=A0A8S0UI62_OLEEU|nr:Hypothetical predicted protein [Olea europaea subsp. europaea]
MPRANRYKLGLAFIIKGVVNAPDNNDRVSYGRLIRGFQGRWAKKFLNAKKKKEKAVSYMVHGFSITVQLHVYAMLRPTEVKRGQPYISINVSFNDHHEPVLDDLARDSVAPQFHVEPLGSFGVGDSEYETFNEDHEGRGPITTVKC